MQLKSKSKGSLNCVGVIKSNDKRAKKYRAIWRENGKQKSKGFENYEDAVKFRKHIEIELINDYMQELEAQIQELNDNTIWWTNRFNAAEREIKHLQQENKQLKEKNNKAIEYLEHERFKREILLGLYETKYMKSIFNNLLEILKGDSNE